MRKASLKDIAIKTKVSVTTVSIVLNGNGKERKISDEVIAKIEKEADELNYRPNQFAKSLRTGKTYTLGLIVDDISNYFFGHLAKIVEEEADNYGYTVMFCNSENDKGKTKNVLHILMNKQMDGYIIAPTSSMLPDIQQLISEKKPMVLIDRFFKNVPAMYVTLDNRKGALDCIDHFVARGYKNIALITNETEQIQMQERFEGYKDGLTKNKLPFKADLVSKINFNLPDQEVVSRMESFITEHPEIDAMLFTSNNLGILGLESLRNLHKKVATDIAVICFDDNDLFRLSSPGISVISQPIKQIGKNAVRMILDQLEKKEILEKHSVLSPNLIIRDSTPPKNNV